ncbi:MAG TPA: hypothetical protein VFR12_12585 [Pyrinomonadaceae bacterium]|nr:hypothetical protein [Pyrinomonadaceae bacterium]
MDDAAAIKRCQQGDRDAFRHLVERYQRRAIGHATAILLQRAKAGVVLGTIVLIGVPLLIIFSFQQIRELIELLSRLNGGR